MDENNTNFFLYTDSNGKVNVEVYIQDETVWLTQKAMGQLFGVESHTVTYHFARNPESSYNCRIFCKTLCRIRLIRLIRQIRQHTQPSRTKFR